LILESLVMTLDQLRIFIAVAERQHMTAAARALNITQSAASAAIAALESRHDVKLFDRVGRGIELTEAGRLFLTEARGVIACAATAERALDDFGNLGRGTLRVVASQTIAAYWLPRFLAAFRSRYPGLSTTLAIGNTEQAAERVKNGEADLGIVEGDVDDGALIRSPLGQDRLMLVGAGPFQGETIDTDWLRAAHWVMREPGSGTRATLDATVREHGIDPATLTISLVLPSNESVRSAVEAGAGIAALSSLVVETSLAIGKLHVLPLHFRTRSFCAIRHRERYQGRPAAALIALITSGIERETVMRSDDSI
jgi:DNA-binding transcriptional LysR family regulator